jgi:hypothetical protein
MFASLFGKPYDQAMGCASEIFEREGKKFLIGSFGSNIDGELYEVLTDGHKLGIICDVCINQSKHDFKLLKDNQHFGIDL